MQNTFSISIRSRFHAFGFLCLLLTLGCGGKPEHGHDRAQEPSAHESRESPEADEWEIEVSEGTETDHGSKGHDHHHKAPHGGTLIALGEHFAHLEVIHDATEGRITVYILDGEAESPVRVEQKSLVMQFVQFEPAMTEGGSSAYTEGVKQFPLEAVANPLTGETMGDTSEFSGAAPFLVGAVAGFTATLQKISLLGSDLENIEIKYPEGNEE